MTASSGKPIVFGNIYNLEPVTIGSDANIWHVWDIPLSNNEDEVNYNRDVDDGYTISEAAEMLKQFKERKKGNG